jgi:hypothetical protein
MNIITENHFGLTWTAVDDDTYGGPGSPIGTGATESEAIEDLIEQIAYRSERWRLIALKWYKRLDALGAYSLLVAIGAIGTT